VWIVVGGYFCPPLVSLASFSLSTSSSLSLPTATSRFNFSLPVLGLLDYFGLRFLPFFFRCRLFLWLKKKYFPARVSPGLRGLFLSPSFLLLLVGFQDDPRFHYGHSPVDYGVKKNSGIVYLLSPTCCVSGDPGIFFFPIPLPPLLLLFLPSPNGPRGKYFANPPVANESFAPSPSPATVYTKATSVSSLFHPPFLAPGK